MAVAYINLLGLYGQMGDIDRARAAYQGGLEHASGSSALHLNYGVLLLREEDNAGAVEALERAVEVEPGKSKAHKLLGVAHQRLGNNDAAIDSFARAFETDSLDVEAGYALGTAQIAAGRFDAAAATLDKTLLPVSPRTPTFLRALAQARLSSGDPAGARDALERARTVASDYSQAEDVELIDQELEQLAELGVSTP
jgi:Flp pilus assembly protein TadD